MRTLIPILFFAVMAYAGWYYLRPLTATPLQEKLLLTDTRTFREMTITTPENTFRIFPTEEGNWAVKQGTVERYDQTYLVEELIRLLDGLRTDSVMHRFPSGAGPDVSLVGEVSKALIAPAAAPNGPPAYADYFDEVMDRDKYFVTLTVHAPGGMHYIEVFRDSQWVKPYVLVGDDYPRRYFALDSLR